MPPQITVLQNLGDGKSLVLITNYITIPTSAAAGAYSAEESLGKEIDLIGSWHGHGALWYAQNIRDTMTCVKYKGIEYSPSERFLRKVDTVKVYIYQIDSAARNVVRFYSVLGVTSV